MVVRGGIVNVQSVWDDTDIVHVVQGEIVSADHHVYSGVRLQSNANGSLVIKLEGQNAGFTAFGRPLEIDDRIGGTIQVLGTAGHPVVMTSIHDDTVGAGFDPEGLEQNNTDNATIAGAGRLAQRPFPDVQQRPQRSGH